MRGQCDCQCIPFEEKCNGVCGVGQCEEGGRCLDSLQLNEKNERIRKACEEKCIPWDQDCR